MRLCTNESISQHRERQGGSRRGTLSIELLLVLPVLMTLLLGMVEFGMILYSRQQLMVASREGARVAALGGDEEAVKQIVRHFLGDGRLGDAKVTLTDGAGQPIATTRAVHSGEPIEVWLRLPTKHAVPDLLRFIGFSIKDDVLVARTAMRKE
jgi:Flp pilus assembly protein TadG